MLIKNKKQIIEKSLSCKGWTNHGKLSLLYDLIIKTKYIKGDILEIGSAWGRSTVLLSLSSKKTVWSIDPHTGGRAFIERNEKQDSYEEFLNNIEKFGLKKRIKILKKTTREVIDKKLMPDEIIFSFVFIDGLHTADGVKSDFELSYDRLNNAGIMAFDDYFEKTAKDYSDMIDTLVEEKSVQLIKDNKSRIVYLIKK